METQENAIEFQATAGGTKALIRFKEKKVWGFFGWFGGTKERLLVIENPRQFVTGERGDGVARPPRTRKERRTDPLPERAGKGNLSHEFQDSAEANGKGQPRTTA